ncbi:MAG TPA: GNAT family N-acetyltransferase [Actinoplanes sp.]|nr:GNAT family N-acetyltransferase [Actinoplanes sp.]
MIVHASSATMNVFKEATRHFTGSSHGAAAFVESPETIALIAMDGPEIQGWCWGHLLSRPDGTTMLYLHDLEVDESHRRQGIARELLNEFMKAGVNHGASRMFLTTGEENTPARHLYETAGALPAAQGPTVNYWFHLSPSHPRLR